MTPELYERFERVEDRHWWFEGRRRVLRSVLRRHLLPVSARALLDVGCGTGGMFRLLEEFGTVEGAEYSPDARARAQRRFPSVKVHPCALPETLPDGKWDVVTAFDVIEHVDDAVAALETMRLRVTPRGQLVVTVPALQFLWSHHDEVNGHRRRYSQALLESQLQAAGFTPSYVSSFNTALLPAVAAARLLERLKPSSAASGDLEPTVEPLNTLLATLFGAERFALALGSLPVGVSLVAVATVD